jgi:hypothetical protein
MVDEADKDLPWISCDRCGRAWMEAILHAGRGYRLFFDRLLDLGEVVFPRPLQVHECYDFACQASEVVPGKPLS